MLEVDRRVLQAMVEREEDGEPYAAMAVDAGVSFGEFLALWQSHGIQERLDLSEDDEGVFELWGPAPTPHGPALYVTKVYNPQVCLAVLTELLSVLPIEGKLALIESDSQHGWSATAAASQISCRIDLRGELFLSLLGELTGPLSVGDLAGDLRGLPRWQIPEADRSKIGQEAARWATAVDGARIYFSAELLSFEVTASSLPALVQDMVRHSDQPCSVLAETADAFRAVHLDPAGGKVVYTCGAKEMPTLVRDAVLHELRDVLVWHAPLAVYGRLRRHRHLWLAVHQNDLPMELWPAWEERPAHADLRVLSEQGLLHDAFGLHLLDLAYFDPSRFDPGDQWVIEPAAPNHVLLSDADNETWFGVDHAPTRNVLAARESLRPLLA